MYLCGQRYPKSEFTWGNLNNKIVASQTENTFSMHSKKKQIIHGNKIIFIHFVYQTKRSNLNFSG